MSLICHNPVNCVPFGSHVSFRQHTIFKRIDTGPSLRRCLAGGAGFLALSASFAGGARAEPRVTLTPAAGPPGAQVTLTGAGWRSGGRVAVRVGTRVLARAPVSRQGRFSARLQVPAAAANGAVALVSKRGRGRVVSRYEISAASDAVGTTEAASSTRARLRVASLDAQTLRVDGSGFPARSLVRLSYRPVGASAATVRLRSLRASRGGAFSRRVAVPSGTARRLVVHLRNRRTRLAVAATLASPDVQPALPIRAAFYYAWFPGVWRQHGYDPYTYYTPSLGFYSSGDPAVTRQHIAAMQYGHIEAGLISWPGQGTGPDARIPAILSATRGTGFHWALYHEQEGRGDPSVDSIRADLVYIRDHYASDPSYLRVAGRFVVFVYSSAGDAAGMVQRWHAANSVGAYLVLKVFPGYQTVAEQPDSWHQYAPAKREDHQPGSSFSISPGFWLRSDPQPRLARDVDAFRRAVVNMDASGEPWQLITTFNEWGEGSAVEPAREWQTASGYGAYLDALHNEGR